jgi:hypothetical protein
LLILNVEAVEKVLVVAVFDCNRSRLW